MELRGVDARSGDRPPDPGQPPRDATRASDAHHARVAASENSRARPGQAARSGVDQPAAAPRSAAEREPLTAPGDAQRLPARPPSRADLGRQRLAERLERAENPVTSRTELRERLNHLEPGHPSSPWEEDGTPRPPAPRLADLERLDPPLGDGAYAAHREGSSGGANGRAQNLGLLRMRDWPRPSWAILSRLFLDLSMTSRLPITRVSFPTGSTRFSLQPWPGRKRQKAAEPTRRHEPAGLSDRARFGADIVGPACYYVNSSSREMASPG
jgi:hypothetical protein